MIVGARAWHASLAWGGASAGIAFPLLGPPGVVLLAVLWCLRRPRSEPAGTDYRAAVV